jgi:hypothetical protein
MLLPAPAMLLSALPIAAVFVAIHVLERQICSMQMRSRFVCSKAAGKAVVKQQVKQKVTGLIH